MLKEQGWVVGDRGKIIVEVDTKQSDFRAQNYKTVSETLKNDMESKYVDYLLLDMFGAPHSHHRSKTNITRPDSCSTKTGTGVCE